MYRIYNIGDCLLVSGDYKRVLHSVDTPDHIITDPPYSEATKNGALTRKDDAPLNGAQFIPFSASEDLVRGALSLIPKRWAVMFCDWRNAAAILQDPPEGYKAVRFGVWNKPDGAPQFTGDRPAPGWEAVAILHNKETVTKWNGGGKRSVWTYNVERQNGHPTPKPLPLMMKIIEQFTDEGDTVLDPFMGSGTTGVACALMGRKFIGIEINDDYFNLAADRIKTAHDQLNLFGQLKNKDAGEAHQLFLDMHK